MYNDYPLEEICAKAEEIVKQGGDVFQKWTCQNCHSRQAMPDANHFYAAGICEECGHTTQITECNYMVLWTVKG